jgi:hypothetical protein
MRRCQAQTNEVSTNSTLKYFRTRKETALRPQRQVYRSPRGDSSSELIPQTEFLQLPRQPALLSRPAPTREPRHSPSQPVVASTVRTTLLPVRVADQRLQPPLQISPQHHFSHAFKGEEGCSSSDEDPPIRMAQSLPSHLTQCKPCLCQLRPLIADLLWNADVQLGLPFRLLLDFHGRLIYMSSAALSRIPNEQENSGPSAISHCSPTFCPETLLDSIRNRTICP